MKGDREKCLEAGAFGLYLQACEYRAASVIDAGVAVSVKIIFCGRHSKDPPSDLGLDRMTQEQIGRASDKSQPPVDTRDDRVNILLVDDEPRNLMVLESILNDPGYRLVRADSADQALLALVSSEFAASCSIFHMPGMNGSSWHR